MPIPDYQSLMKPILNILADGKLHSTAQILDGLIKELGVPDEVLTAMLPSGKQRILDNRTGWAITYLSKARLIERPERGLITITPRGKELLVKKDAINNAVLKQYPEFLEFLHKSRAETAELSDKTKDSNSEKENTPEETLESAYQTLNESLKDELLEKVKASTPRFFENLIIDLLIKMGYGGSRKDAGSAIGKSGDGGIDGIIKEDKLGLDIIYLQAKKWDGTVPVTAVRDFAGALLGKKAKKGIMITTSSFPKSAYEYVEHLEQKIILIDGDRLTDLMIENNIGANTERSFDIKKMDLDYFDEE
jgi:restriction system protein